MIFLLLTIILLLIYIAFLTPERRWEREVRRVQKIFNAPVPELPLFHIDDNRNETHPDEMVTYEYADGERGMSHRKLAVMTYKMEENLKTPLSKSVSLEESK